MSDFLTSLFNSDNSANHGISGDADNELNEGSSSDKFGLNDSNFITSELFGLNLKMDLGDRIDQAGDALSDEVIDLNPGVLRYPGGTVTEQYADLIFEHVIDGTKNDQAWLDRQDELDIQTDRVRFEQNNGNFKAQGSSGKFKYDDNGQTIVNGPLYLDEFLDRAADNSASVVIVIPTATAFATSVADALIHDDGKPASQHIYGSRLATADYIETIEDFVRAALTLADQKGITVAGFEIGNEYNLGGGMTSTEYGHLAVEVATAVDGVYDEPAIANLGNMAGDAPSVLVQSIGASGVKYSPSEDITVKINSNAYTIPDQGSAETQNQKIIDIIKNADAEGYFDGVTTHYYDGGQLQDLNGRSFMFEQVEEFANQLAPNGDDFQRYITEWSMPLKDTNPVGLAAAQAYVEKFYNMVEHDIDVALTYGLNTNFGTSNSLTFKTGDKLSFRGEAVKMLNDESMIGLTSVLDWESANEELALNAFADTETLVLFLGERSGNAQNNVSLDLSAFGLTDATFTSATLLRAGGTTNPLANSGDPELVTLTQSDVFTNNSLNTTSVDLDDWSLLRIEIDLIGQTRADGIVTGTSGADTIKAVTFQDIDGDQINNSGQEIQANGGNDKIYDGAGNDFVFAGSGKDIMYSGGGVDTYNGGSDRDIVSYKRAPSSGNDKGLLIDLTDTSNSEGYAKNDTYISIERVYGTDYDDTMIGNTATRTLFGGKGDDHITDGAARSFLKGQAGIDTFKFIADGDWDRIYDFKATEDKIDISAWGVTSFDELEFGTYSNTNKLSLSIIDTNETIQFSNLYASDQSAVENAVFIFAEPPQENIIVNTISSNTPTMGDDIATTYIGDSGNKNIISYRNSTDAELTIDLTDPSNSTGFAQGDIFENIDRIYGSDENDTIIGDGLVGILFGYDGDDHITDGANKQYLRGHTGQDTFKFIADSTDDVIYDFNLADDTLDLSDWGVTQLNGQIDFREKSNGRLELFEVNGDETIELRGYDIENAQDLADYIQDFQNASYVFA